MRNAFKRVDAMEAPLWALQQFFDDIDPGTLISEANDTLSKVAAVNICWFLRSLLTVDYRFLIWLFTHLRRCWNRKLQPNQPSSRMVQLQKQQCKNWKVMCDKWVLHWAHVLYWAHLDLIIKQRFGVDANKATVAYYREVMMKIVMPFLLKVVTPLTDPVR